jgi:hypothetical protein
MQERFFQHINGLANPTVICGHRIIGCLIFSLGGVASAGVPIYVPKDTRAQDFENSMMNIFQMQQMVKQRKTSEKMTTFMMLQELRKTKKAEYDQITDEMVEIIKPFAPEIKQKGSEFPGFPEEIAIELNKRLDMGKKLKGEIDEIEDAMRELAGLKKKEKK